MTTKPAAHTAQPPKPAHDFATDHPGATLMLQLALVPALIGLIAWNLIKRTKAKLGYRTVTAARRGIR